MKRLILLLFILIPFLGYSQGNVSGDELRIYQGASIGEDGTIYPLDMNGNLIKNLQDPIDLQDAVTKQWFLDNALSSIMVFDSIMWNTNVTNLTVEKGKLYLDSAFQSLRYSPDGINSIFLGRMVLSPLVFNNTGLLIENLKGVYINGEDSGKLSIELADKSNFDKSQMLGVTTENIASGGIGNVTRIGLVQGNTSALYSGVAVGDKVYLDNDGNMTNIQATGGDFDVYIGVIKKLGITDGELYVDPVSDHLTAEINSGRGWSSDVVSSTTLSPNGATRTFSIIGTGYTYENGFKYEWDNPSVVWDDIEGTVDIYFENGILTAANNLTESEVRAIYSSKAGVSRIYWDATNKDFVFANDMRHTVDMNGDTWSTFWDIDGCVVTQGLGLTDIIADGSGNVDASAQFGHGSGLIRNQDIITSIPLVSSVGGYTVFYRDGINNWRSQDGTPFPVLTAGTGRLAWNEDVGGTWQLSEVGNNDFVLCHLFASNTLGDKTGTVVGQVDYGSLGDARDGAKREINSLLFSQFPIQELTPVATLIFQTSNAYNNAVQGRVRSSEDQFGDLVDYIDWRDSRAVGGSSGGTGASSFDDLDDTPAVKTGSAGLGVIVNPTEDALIYAEIARTINGQSPISGNYNITSTANKIGEDVTIGTSGTGIDAVFSVADNDNSTTNELQDLGNSKLNNDITVTISNGTNTTITDIARTDFLNPTLNTSSLLTGGVQRIDASGNISASGGSFDNTTFNPITISRTAFNNVNIKILNSIGFKYLGLDEFLDLKFGNNESSVLNSLIYHSGNSNLSTIDWSAKDITASGTATAPTAKLTTGAVVDKVWTCTNIDGSGAWDDAATSYKSTQTLTGSSPTYDCSISVNAKMLIPTSLTPITLTNLVDGMSGNLRITQDASGGGTISISPTPKVVNGGNGTITLTGTAGSTDVISWWYDGTNLNVVYGLNFN